MGPLGTGELVLIFFLALLLFGPKELPKLGKTIGKAMTEFRRAQTELKSTFDREMRNLERESGIKELAQTTFDSNSYNYDHSSYDSSYYDNGAYDSSLNTSTSTDGASAHQGAASTAPLQVEAAVGSIPTGGYPPPVHEDYYGSSTPAAWSHSEPAIAEHGVATTPVGTVDKITVEKTVNG
jgi:sec-independent protein translocase protein TatA